MGTYRLNGTDIANLGFIADSSRNTSNSFEQSNDPKPVFSHEWGDENGVEYDNVSPVVKQARSFKLDGYLYAVSEGEYVSNKAALLALLYQPILTISATEVNVTVNAKFKGFSTWQRMSQIKGSDKIVTKVTMEFNELMGTSIPTYDLYYGPSAALPTTALQVQALNQTTYAGSVILNTGVTYSRFSFGIKNDKSIISVTDLDGGGFYDLTDLYTLRFSTTISGNTYDIYSLENALSYSINHRHQFILA